MADAYAGVGTRLWLGTDSLSFALEQAAGSVTMQPVGTTTPFSPLGTGVTHREVVNRATTWDFETLYWRPGSDDLLTFLEDTDEIRAVVEFVNGSCAVIAGPLGQFTVTAPTSDLIKISGTITNGVIGSLVGAKVLEVVDGTPTQWSAATEDFGASPVGFASFDWTAGFSVVTVVDSIERTGTAASVVALSVDVSNMVAADNSTTLTPVAAMDIFESTSTAGDQLGAGISVNEIVTASVGVASGTTRRATLSGDTVTNASKVSASVFVVQPFGAADF